MNILLLTQWFDPEPTFKGLVFAKALQDNGHQVEVITGFPNYPGGRLYPGYKLKWRHRENIDGIKITRVFLVPSHSGSIVGRIINYLSFAVSACLVGLFNRSKIDVVYVYHPPITVGIAAAIIGAIRRIPFLLDIQDLWPDSLRATGMVNNAYLLNIVGKFCQWVYKRAKHIVVLSSGFRRILIERKVSAAKIDIVYNWANEQLLFTNKDDFSKLVKPSWFTVVFAGNMGKAQALYVVLLAAKRVEQLNAKIHFIFVGSGIEVAKLQEFVRKQQIDNVIFVPQVPINEVKSVLQLADILLVHLKDDPLFEITIPSKLQAYLAVGKPILMAVKGDAAELIVQAKAGYCAQPEDIDSITEAILDMATLPKEVLLQMGQNGKDFYNKNLSLNVGVSRFLRIFDLMIKSGKIFVNYPK